MESNTSPITGQPNEPKKPVIRTLLANKIKVVLQDYHSQYLAGFSTFLNLAGFNVVAGVSSEIDLIVYLNSNTLPDILIINYKSTQPQTLDLARLVKEKYPFLMVIINTQYISELLLNELKCIGIEGFILKAVYDKNQITTTLLTVYNGNKTL